MATRIGMGNAAAEGELFERYGRGVAFLLRRLGIAEAEVEDLRQETFQVVLQRLRGPGLEEPAALVGFVHGTARNLAINERRKWLRRRTENDSSLLEDKPARQPDPLAETLRKEEARRVHQAIARLPNARDRQLLLRYYVNDEDKDGICADLGVERSHFRRILFRARERFRELAGLLLLAIALLLAARLMSERRESDAEIARLRARLEGEEARASDPENQRWALERELDERPSPAIEARLLPVFLGALRSADGRPSVEIAPAPDIAAVLLIFELEGEAAAKYRMTLLREGRNLFEQENLASTDLGLVLAVPRPLLLPGTYQLRIAGDTDGREIAVGEITFAVR